MTELCFAAGGKSTYFIGPVLDIAGHRCAGKILGGEPEVAGHNAAFRHNEFFGGG